MDENTMINTFLEIVDNQIKANNPPLVSATLNRLTNMGYTNIDARKLIAIALSKIINHTLQTKTLFDEEKYNELLNKLPDYK